YSATTDIPRYDRLIEYRNSHLRDGEWYYGPQKWTMNSLSVNYKPFGSLFDNLNTTVAYQVFEESRHNRSFGKTLLSHKTEKVDVFSVNIDLDKKLTEKHNVHYGTEIMLNNVNSSGEDEDIVSGFTSAGSTRYPDAS